MIFELYNDEMSLLNYVSSNQIDDDIFAIDSNNGICSAVMKTYLARGAVPQNDCREFIGLFQSALGRQSVRYGGIFSMDNLYLSIGLPCLGLSISCIAASLLDSKSFSN